MLNERKRVIRLGVYVNAYNLEPGLGVSNSCTAGATKKIEQSRLIPSEETGLF